MQTVLRSHQSNPAHTHAKRYALRSVPKERPVRTFFPLLYFSVYRRYRQIHSRSYQVSASSHVSLGSTENVPRAALPASCLTIDRSMLTCSIRAPMPMGFQSFHRRCTPSSKGSHEGQFCSVAPSAVGHRNPISNHPAYSNPRCRCAGIDVILEPHSGTLLRARTLVLGPRV